MSFGNKHIIECGNNLKLSVCGCLDVLGISLLSEWDVLAFVHRHGASLTSAEQIARLLGYEDSVVESALDRLEREMLIGRSRPSRGCASTDSRPYQILNVNAVSSISSTCWRLGTGGCC